jgi:plastocyanin
VKRARAAVAAVVAVAAGAAGAAGASGCGDSCVGTACAPMFDVAFVEVQDLAVVHDVAITSAAVVVVGPGGLNVFSPATVTIAAGESVTWDWVSGFHSIVSDTQAFASSPGQASGQYTVMFPMAGTFPYHCGVHGAMMTGTVVVQ